MKAYRDLVTRVRTQGDVMPNRTGVDSVKVAGEMMKIDLRAGFPILTGKKTAYKAAINETACFFRGYTSAAQFREMGVNVWNQNANEHGVKPNAWLSNPFRDGVDHLGSIYGDQWRNWPGFKLVDWDKSEQIKALEEDGWQIVDEVGHGDTGLFSKLQILMYKSIDQVANCVKTIITNPTDRRIIFHAWNPAELGMMALPPCHTLYQFFPNTNNGYMDMCLYLRSNDIALGTPFNMIGAATILTTIAKVTGYKPRFITFFIGDAHVYVDSFEYLDEMLSNEPLPLPKMEWSNAYTPSDEEFSSANPDWIKDALSYLTTFTSDDFVIKDYQHHTLKTPVPKMAV